MKNLKCLMISASICLISACNKPPEKSADVSNSPTITEPDAKTAISPDEYSRYGEVIVQIQKLELERRELERKLAPLNGNIACIQSENGPRILCGGGSESGPGREGPNPPEDNGAKDRAAKEKAENDRAAKVEADRQVTDQFVNEMNKSNTPEAKAAAEAAKQAHEVCKGGGRCIGD